MTLDIAWVASEDILTNETIFEQTEDIKNLVVIGGGYIGCELSEALSKLWVQVHLVQRNKYLLPREELESRELTQTLFEKQGIQIYTESQVIESENKILKVQTPSWVKEIPYDKILIALGRIPNVEKLWLENAEVKYSKRGIEASSSYQTSQKHIFAIGDCVSWNPQFTHLANHQGRSVIQNILVPFFKSKAGKYNLPSVLYTSHELARVGKTHEELLEIYDAKDIVTKKMYFDHNDRAKVTKSDEGFIMMHIKKLTWKILWVTIYGKNAGEILGQATLSMDYGLSAYKLSKTIQAYPTRSDLLKRTADSFVVGTLGNIKEELIYFFKKHLLTFITATIWISILSTFLVIKTLYQLSLEDIALGLYHFIRENPIGPILYVFAYVIRPVIFFPATLMTFLSGLIFWFWGGFAYTMIWETGSALFAYMLGWIFWKSILWPEWVGLLGSLQKKLNTSPFISVLTARFLFFPFDLTNYAFGFLKVKLSAYTLATFLWIIPGMSIFILAGSAFYNSEITSLSDTISSVDTTMLLYAALLFVLTLLWAKVLKKYTS